MDGPAQVWSVESKVGKPETKVKSGRALPEGKRGDQNQPEVRTRQFIQFQFHFRVPFPNNLTTFAFFKTVPATDIQWLGFGFHYVPRQRDAGPSTAGV